LFEKDNSHFGSGDVGNDRSATNMMRVAYFLPYHYTPYATEQEIF